MGIADEDRYYMQLALSEALIAASENEVPVGAVLFARQQGLVFKDHNRCIALADPTAHAEILVIRSASKTLGLRLDNCVIYSTLEPCTMCMGAIMQSNISFLYYALGDSKIGFFTKTGGIACFEEKYSSRLRINDGLLANDARQLLGDFFQAKRTDNTKNVL